MSNSDKYQFINLKPVNYIYIIIVIVIISLIVILFQDSIVAYDTKAVVVKDSDNTYLIISVPIEKMKYFTENNYLLIDKKRLLYKIIKIDKEIIIINNVNHQNIIIDTSLPKQKQQENLVIDIKIIIKKLKIYQKIGNILTERE